MSNPFSGYGTGPLPDDYYDEPEFISDPPERE